MLLTNIPRTLVPCRLPARLTPSALKLPKADHATLLKKSAWLQRYQPILPRRVTHDPSCATYVFAQEEAGTAVCISPAGILLTCSHCVSEKREELDWGRVQWLLSGEGSLVGARCIAWDERRDLALLLVVTSNGIGPYAHLELSSTPPVKSTQLLCVGHPGSEDLETDVPGIQTNYDVLVVSQGSSHGLCRGQDPHDNSEIGALMHDCWTYWGHSGAPLVGRTEGRLMGVHSSWDDETGMRRGVGWECVWAFLGEFEGRMGDVAPDGWVWWSRGDQKGAQG